MMNLNQWQSEGSHNEERMTGAETKAVLSLWEQRHGPPPSDTASVADLAEGLDADAAEVQRLLEEVRKQRLDEERLLADQKRRLASEQNRLREAQAERARLGTGQRDLRQRAVFGIIGGSVITLVMGMITGAFITSVIEKEPGILARLNSPLDRFWAVALMTSLGLMLLGTTLFLGWQVWKDLRAWGRSRRR